MKYPSSWFHQVQKQLDGFSWMLEACLESSSLKWRNRPNAVLEAWRATRIHRKMSSMQEVAGGNMPSMLLPVEKTCQISNSRKCKFTWAVSLGVQWLRICLPMQRTRVQSPLWEDPTCIRTTKPQLSSLRAWNLALPQEKPPQREARTLQLEKTSVQGHKDLVHTPPK